MEKSTYIQNFFSGPNTDELIPDLIENVSLLTEEIENLSVEQEHLKEKLSFCQSELLKIASREDPEANLKFLKQHDLLAYLYKQQTPSSLFAVLQSSEYSTCFLLQTGLVVPNTTCQCGKPLKLLHKPNTPKYFYSCRCGKKTSLLNNTIWENYRSSPQRLLFSIILWLVGTRNSDTSRLIGRDKRKEVQTLLESIVSKHFTETLPKFRGTVEIDESCFKGKSTKPSKSAPEKWVFGMYERERKLVYMEVVPTRSANFLIPIIQRVCEPGTTIISDQWAAYNKLEEFGFPHYTVDHSRFFVNPHNREIHTQDIEISWGWAKYEVRRQNKKLMNLQDHLNVFCWKRKFKGGKSKNTELAQLLSTLSKIVKEVQLKKS